MDVKWNANGNWALTASRDHLVKVYDIRNMKEEMQVFRGHKKEATCEEIMIMIIIIMMMIMVIIMIIIVIIVIKISTHPLKHTLQYAAY